MDSASYGTGVPFSAITVPEGARLALVAADWPAIDDPDAPGGKRRVVGQFVPDEQWPHLFGDLVVHGTAPAPSIDPGHFIIDGLLVEGRLDVIAGNLGTVLLAHGTLAPASGGVRVAPSNSLLSLAIGRSIVGPITLQGGDWRLSISDSIIDGTGADAIVAPTSAADIQTSTLFGAVSVAMLEAGNSIFTRKVVAARRQAGCTRFCYLPLDSLSPRRYRCQPTDAASATRIAPQFVSTVFSQPGYGQLGPANPVEIDTGADDEGQMGAFRFLQQAQRARNLRARLEEYLSFGLEAGLFFVT
jgi:hypothetical protein